MLRLSTLLAFGLLSADATPHGLDLAGVDPAIAPGDDFDGYANGRWRAATEIPKDRNSWGPAGVLTEEVDHRLRSLMEEAKAGAAAGSEARKVGDLFASFMDEAGIESKGLKPLRPELDGIARIKDRAALARALGASVRADVDPLNDTRFQTPNVLGLWVAPSFSDPTHNAAYLLQGGIVLPDREYYFSDAAKMVELREKYRAYAADLFRVAGFTEPEARAGRVLDLETQIAKAHVVRADSEDVQKANNPWARADFAKKAPGLDWAAFFKAAGLDKQAGFIVWHPSALSGIADLAGKAPLEAWRDLLAFHAVDHATPLLSKAFVDLRFGFHSKALNGTPEQQERWKRAVAATNENLSDAVGQLYVKRYFPPEAKAKGQAMVAALIGAFDKRIDALAWMAPATRAKAKAKLKTLYVGVGYPEVWREYGKLRIAADDLVGNVERAEAFEYQRSLARLGKAPDAREWAMEPQRVDAVNLPLSNAINFPAAIMQPPYFDPEADPAINFAAMGAIIGHEISHSFDDQGAQFDEHGKLENWWTPEDAAHFKGAAEKLVAEFDAYQPFPDLRVNGRQCLSENIADVAGLAVAHDGWRASLGGGAPPKIQGLSGEQAFFLS
ncbi:MAG TPA: M13 family metallopeptidase, partial [Myxococcaceae bacterium]|nr:M13 family metallopeptidase [Myxococcaceae bacterium]